MWATEKISKKLNELREDLNEANKLLSDYYPDIDGCTDMFDDYLHDSYGNINLCGLNYSVAGVLRKTDLVRYECWLSDWVDEEFTNNPRKFEDYVEIESHISDLQNEIDTFEQMLDEGGDNVTD